MYLSLVLSSSLDYKTNQKPVYINLSRCIVLRVCITNVNSLPFSLPQAIWEWGDQSKQVWHPFERDTNIQIEEMYDSGSQWAELTLCLPSPMPFLLDLHDMKLVNFRTAVRYSLRRIDNYNYVPDGKISLYFSFFLFASCVLAQGARQQTEARNWPLSALFRHTCRDILF